MLDADDVMVVVGERRRRCCCGALCREVSALARGEVSPGAWLLVLVREVLRRFWQA
jgi:hypothetical protein